MVNCEEEKERYISFCGSYCRTCDWFTGRIRSTFQSALGVVEMYGGFRKWLEGKVDIENLKEIKENGIEYWIDKQLSQCCKSI